MAGCLLHVSERHAGVEGGGDEGVAKGVRPDRLVDPRPTRQASHDPPGGVAIEPLPVPSKEDRALQTLADGEVDGAGRARRKRDGDDLAALAQHRQGAMAAFESERLDVGAGRLRHTQPVDGQEGDEGVLPRRRQASGDEQRPDLVAVEPVACDS